MKQEIKDKWVAALLSGEYEQGQGYLCNDGKYCCLGVLCDLYLQEQGKQWDYAPLEVSDYTKPFVESVEEPGKIEPQMKTLQLYECDSKVAREPDAVNEWAGFTKIEATPLVRMNDDAQSSFAAIAEYINENM